MLNSDFYYIQAETGTRFKYHIYATKYTSKTGKTSTNPAKRVKYATIILAQKALISLKKGKHTRNINFYIKYQK